MELEKVIPGNGTFTLVNTGDTIHELRHFTLEDHVWMKEELDLSLEELIEKTPKEQMPILIRLAYRLIKDKSPFAKKAGVKVIDEEGNELIEELGGVKLFARMIVGPDEYNRVLLAWLKVLKGSEVSKDEIPKGQKKKAKDKDKVIGETSLTQ